MPQRKVKSAYENAALWDVEFRTYSQIYPSLVLLIGCEYNISLLKACQVIAHSMYGVENGFW